MIDIVRPPKPDPDDMGYQMALAIFGKFHPAYAKWTPQNTLMMNVASPPEVLAAFEDDITLARELAPALAGGKPIESELKQIDNTVYLIFSGEGAANLARTMRDTLEMQFPGCASIPEGPAKA